MSLVTVILIQKNTVQIQQCHWRELKKILSYELFNAQLPAKETTSRILDEGYLLIDVDKHILVNRQTAVAIPASLFKQWLIYSAHFLVFLFCSNIKP